MDSFHKSYLKSLGYRARIRIYLKSRWLIFRYAERPWKFWVGKEQ